MLLQQNHLRSLPPLVGVSVVTTQQNLVEVDANGTPLGSSPNAILMYLFASLPRTYRCCGHSQHDHWLLPGNRYIPVLRSEVVTTSAVHCY